MSKRAIQGLAWGRGPQHLIDAELRDQADYAVRGERLRARADRILAATLDGTTADPLGDGFQSARLVGIPQANRIRTVD